MTERLAGLRQFWVYAGTDQRDGWPVVGPIHAPEVCEAPCAYHSPSDHPLRDAPMALGVMFTLRIPLRICEHGVAHPDPDGLLHLRRIGVLGAVTFHPCCEHKCCGGVE